MFDLDGQTITVTLTGTWRVGFAYKTDFTAEKSFTMTVVSMWEAESVQLTINEREDDPTAAVTGSLSLANFEYFYTVLRTQVPFDPLPYGGATFEQEYVWNADD